MHLHTVRTFIASHVQARDVIPAMGDQERYSFGVTPGGQLPHSRLHFFIDILRMVDIKRTYLGIEQTIDDYSNDLAGGQYEFHTKADFTSVGRSVFVKPAIDRRRAHGARFGSFVLSGSLRTARA
jgi:hypothetical protein